VQRAERDCLVRRQPSTSDGRVVHLELTDEGEARLAASVEEHGPERQLLYELISRIGG
jgi:DNA-binding MarR family transcriptional regulator